MLSDPTADLYQRVRHTSLDDIDLGNRRITIGGITRPLDDLTHRILLDHLNERRERWPHASNPHLFINSHTTWTTAPVSKNYLFQRLETRLQTGPKPPGLDAIRADRVLEEALHQGPDALRLIALFGLNTTTAVQYTIAARRILHD